MTSAKFYVLGGGRWRELDTTTGRVEGWGGARFLYMERGRLRAVRRAPVLRGLRALAAGRARAVHDGAPLSQISESVKEKRPPRERRVCCHHAHFGCGVNAHFNMQLKPVSGVHAGVQANLPPARNNFIDKEAIVQNKREILRPTAVKPHRNNVTVNSSDEDLSASIMQWNRKRKMREIRGAELCKELIIAEEDVMLLRNYIEKDEKNVFKVDLEKFDADDAYKSRVFYKLNPLVNVERCGAIADMTWDGRSQSTVTLKDFITNLGLRRVDEPSPSRTSHRTRKRRADREPRESENEQDKENLASKRQPKSNKRPNRVLGESVGEKPNSDRVKGKVKASEATSRPTRGSRRPEESAAVEVSYDDGASERIERKVAAPHKRTAGGREYGPAEDAAIVRWVRAGGRAHLVNGNRLWRELQPEHRRLTGHFRSWHSLRNRYLRYLLPSLGAMLEASAAAELRAAAARGEIKARPPPRRHSLLALPPVSSAWARRPRPPDPDESLTGRARIEERQLNVSEPTRSLRSSGATLHADTPTYSELTKRFAEQHRSTPDSDASQFTEPERRASKRLRVGKNAESSIRLDDVSSRKTETPGPRVNNSVNNERTARSSRYAERSNRNADNSSQTNDSADRRKPRTRRLYNPNP